jgi:hypothetical protein
MENKEKAATVGPSSTHMAFLLALSHDGPVLVISMIQWLSTAVKHWDAQSPEEPGQMNSSDEFIVFLVQDTTQKDIIIYIYSHSRTAGLEPSDR